MKKSIVRETRYEVLYKKTFLDNGLGDITLRVYLLDGKPTITLIQGNDAIGVELRGDDLIEVGKAIVSAWEKRTAL